MHFDSDRESIEVGLGSIGLTRPEHSKIIRIQNTSRLEFLDMSAAYTAELKDRSDLEIARPPQPMVFDEEGNLK